MTIIDVCGGNVSQHMQEKFFFVVYTNEMILETSQLPIWFQQAIYRRSSYSFGKNGCDIQTRQTDMHDESIRVPSFAVWIQNPKKIPYHNNHTISISWSLWESVFFNPSYLKSSFKNKSALMGIGQCYVKVIIILLCILFSRTLYYYSNLCIN